MARLPRLFMPGCAQHIIQRGNNRQACFFTEKDYLVYLKKLNEASVENRVAIHAFVLMTNHVHLLVTPNTQQGTSQMMQSLGRYYVRYINKTYKRTGTLWEGRFKSTIVDTDNYLFTLYRYIEMNPVRAGLVDNPGSYPWSSFNSNANDKRIALITPHSLYINLGKTNFQRRINYISLFNDEISNENLEAIRDSANKGWVLGDNNFVEQIQGTVNRRASPLEKGGNRRTNLT